MANDRIMNNHGGKRQGAGRKPGDKEPKRHLGVRVDRETREHLEELSHNSLNSKAMIVEYAIKSLKTVPIIIKI